MVLRDVHKLAEAGAVNFEESSLEFAFSSTLLGALMAKHCIRFLLLKQILSNRFTIRNDFTLQENSTRF